MTNIYQFEAELLDGKNKSFADYEGEVLLIVNTASKCGFTPQFAGLEKIYEQYHAQGFEVLGFPCNQFGGQDPGSNEQIGTYCQKNYGVTFPMFSKVDVKGPEAHAIFRYLTNNSKGMTKRMLKKIVCNIVQNLIYFKRNWAIYCPYKNQMQVFTTG